MKILYVTLFFMASLCIPHASFAQKKAKDAVNVGGKLFKKTTVIDFNSDTFTGDLTRPDGEYIEARKRVKHQRLIKLRKHFRKMIRKSVRNL